MRLVRACVVVCSLLFAIQALAQTSSAPNQGVALLERALAALAPSSSITDITLSGKARRIAGSDDESGTVVVRALTATGSRIDLALPSGTITEVRNVTATAPAGFWSGPDGTVHTESYHNLLVDPGWSPAFVITGLLSAQNGVITHIGPETRNSQSVIHIAASQQFTAPSGHLTALMPHLTATDFYLDATTLLPAAFTFNTHPNGNALLDIPVELDFSSYQTVSGAQIPLHLRKFINHSLALDLQFTSATINSGISASIFNIQ